jgi:AmmeMemoRadiSam system protein B
MKLQVNKDMKLLFLILIVFILGLIIIFNFSRYKIVSSDKSVLMLNNITQKKQAIVNEEKNISVKTIKVKFFEESLFNKSVELSSVKVSPVKEKIKGGIVPHHLLASSIIAEFFKYLAESKPKRIILIGPNHYEAGDYAVISSSSGWKTPSGILKADTGILKAAKGYSFISNNDDVLENEHSVSGIMPFIKYYMPDSYVVPFIVSKNINSDDLENLSGFLTKYSDNDTVIIASVDFSHYLKYQNAQKNDKETLKLLEMFDYKSLLKLGNDYLDSPASLAILLMVMNNVNANKLKVINHTNSSNILNDFESQSTGYYTIMYYK